MACHILLEALDKGYNFASDLTSIEGLHKKLWASKVAGVGPVVKHKKYYKGEGGLPQVWAMVNLVSSCLPVVIHAPKVFQLRINQLIV